MPSERVEQLRKVDLFAGLKDEALELIAELQPKQAYLTHISHMLGFHAEVSKTLPANVQLAYDGLRIEV